MVARWLVSIQRSRLARKLGRGSFDAAVMADMVLAQQ